jgi:hypothetical protein
MSNVCQDCCCSGTLLLRVNSDKSLQHSLTLGRFCLRLVRAFVQQDCHVVAEACSAICDDEVRRALATTRPRRFFVKLVDEFSVSRSERHAIVSGFQIRRHIPDEWTVRTHGRAEDEIST